MPAALPWTSNCPVCVPCRLRYMTAIRQQVCGGLRRIPSAAHSRNLTRLSSLPRNDSRATSHISGAKIWPLLEDITGEPQHDLRRRWASCSSVAPAGASFAALGCTTTQKRQVHTRPPGSNRRGFHRSATLPGWAKGSWDSSSSLPHLTSRNEDSGLLPHERLARDRALGSFAAREKQRESAYPVQEVQGNNAFPPRRAVQGRTGDLSEDKLSSSNARDRAGPDRAQYDRRHPERPSQPPSRSPRAPGFPNTLGQSRMQSRQNHRPEQDHPRAAGQQPPRRTGPMRDTRAEESPRHHGLEWAQLARKSTGTGNGELTERRRAAHPHQSSNYLRKPAKNTAGKHQGGADAFLSDLKSRVTAMEQDTPSKRSKGPAWVRGAEIEQEHTKKTTNPASEPGASSWTEKVATETSPNPPSHHGERRARGHLDKRVVPDRDRVPRKPAGRRAQHNDEDEYDDDKWEVLEERRRRKPEKRVQKNMEAANGVIGPTPILLPQFISVSNLAAALNIKSDHFVHQLMEMGFENISHDSIMTGETAALVAAEYGFDPKVDEGEARDLKPRPPCADPSTLPPRPPIVTIMGHVDHGKTTMLDWLRKSSIAAQEHGGITQHIGAFSVKLSSGQLITFLDTPGHAAFLTMRQRGANVTDIVVLVVAADDSVKPQTLEAIKHARAAKVPIIVAINKVDKDEARIDQVKADLARSGVEIEDFGGDVQVVCVSGKTGQGMNDLEENILTLSEILDMRAESDGMAEGWILESSITSTGKLATVLVKRGTLRPGDYVVAGPTWAKIRTLRNEAGIEIEQAPPGTPVEILGWRDTPSAGDEVLQAPNESRAKAAAEYRKELKEREAAMADNAMREQQEREKAEREALQQDGAEPSSPDTATKLVNFAVKGDVMGSVEAVCAAVMEVGNNEVRPRILRSSTGQITEFDVEHAAMSGSYILNFNNPIPGFIRRLAENSKVRVLDHSVIYHLTDDVKDKLSDLLPPTISSKVLGEAEVLQVFPINLKGRVFKNIAGCRVRNGQLTRSAKYRVLRKGEKVFDGKADALKQGKKDTSEVRKGMECGLSFEEWDDLRQGDEIQAYEEIREKRHL